MLNSEWKVLKSGSDIRGVASEGDLPINLTDDVVKAIAAGFVVWLTEKTGLSSGNIRVSVGHDSRVSAGRMKKAILSAFEDAGCVSFDCGLMSTPAMFSTCIDDILCCHGAIMITASHHPSNRNGMKFFTADGGLEGKDIESVLELAQNGKKAQSDDDGNITEYDFLSVYSKNLVDLVREMVHSESNFEKPLAGFHIVVDAGNGAGGFYVEKILKPLGADTSGSQFLEPDGTFPNHIPNPEDETAMKYICDAVVKNKADIGLIFDTDVDRAGAVDSKGKSINRNRLIALIAAILLAETPGATIVTDSITSTGLKSFIEDKLGGTHYRFKRGYKNVINEAIRLNMMGTECPIAIETSGHAALKENRFLDDGAYLVTKVLIKMAQLREQGEKLEDLLNDLSEPAESKEIRMGIKCDDFLTYGNQIIKDLTEHAEMTGGWEPATDNYEGIRVSFGKNDGDGWFLLRMSLHDPIIPVNIESNTVGGVEMIAKKLYKFLTQYENLDTSHIEKMVIDKISD